MESFMYWSNCPALQFDLYAVPATDSLHGDEALYQQNFASMIIQGRI